MWTADHEWTVMSALLGEPVLVGRFLLYRRAREAFLCGWPLDKHAPISCAEVAGIIRHPALWGTDSLHMWGPSVVDLPASEMDAWTLWYVRPPKDHDWLMQTDLTTAPVFSATRRRRVRQQGYGLEVRPGFPGNDSVQPLVDPYLSRSDLPQWDRTYLKLSLRPELYEHATCFVATLADRSTGLAVCRPPADGTLIARWGLFEKGAKAVSDFLYMEFINYYHRRGSRLIDIGYGATASLFGYKRRLGFNQLLGPVWRYGFRRP